MEPHDILESMKYCTLCSVNEVSEKISWCDSCNKNYQRQYRNKNKEKLSEQNKKWRTDNREYNKAMQYNYYKSTRGRVVDLHHAAKRRAKEKKIEFELSTDFIVEMWEKQNGKCALTQIEFLIPQERTGGKASPFAPSIDRIDSSKGYTKDNVRLVCVAVNYALNEFGEETFKIICQAYLNSITQNIIAGNHS